MLTSPLYVVSMPEMLLILHIIWEPWMDLVDDIIGQHKMARSVCFMRIYTDQQTMLMGMMRYVPLESYDVHLNLKCGF